jgi:hypothetical protein
VLVADNVIEYLGNDLQIPALAVSTHDAFNAVQFHSQLSNRFEPALLRRWTLTDDYLRLLASFEIALPCTVDVHVARLRRIFGRDTLNIRTVSGVGYAIEPPADE